MFLGALLLLYLTVSLRHLTVVPPVYEDEPWQASTGLKLANDGVFGSDLFRGLNGMERRYYGYMPIHPLLLAVTYRVAGFGLMQTRLEPVALGFITLLLTYALGRRLFDPTIGVLAVAILLLSRTAGLTRIQPTGILLIDMARIGRYDMVVPVFGLAALHLYLSAERQPLRWWLFAVAGALAGLAGLSHLYGAFWIVVLILLAGWNGEGWRALGALAAGFSAPWVLYLGYVLGDLPAWVAQTRVYAPRFRLTSASWYWANIVNEFHRYGPGLGSIGLQALARPGFWAAVAVLPASFAALGWRAAGHSAGARTAEATRAARAILVPGLVLPILFAILLTLKLANYLVTVAPIFAVVAAWGGVTFWRQASLAPARSRWGRVAIATLLIAVAIEGVSRYVALEQAAERTTPYADFVARIRPWIPAGARVVGLHNYWFGLEDFDYRSFVVPLALAGPSAVPPAPSLAEALDGVDPDVVLLDVRMRTFMVEVTAPGSETHPIDLWLASRGFVLVSTIDDDTYGRLEIYRRERGPR